MGAQRYRCWMTLDCLKSGLTLTLNSQHDVGFSEGSTSTCPLRTSWTLIFFRAKEAVCPPRTSRTGMRLRWMDLMGIGIKSPSPLGPRSSVSLTRMTPFRQVPDTTTPTPCKDTFWIHASVLIKFSNSFVNLERYIWWEWLWSATISAHSLIFIWRVL